MLSRKTLTLTLLITILDIFGFLTAASFAASTEKVLYNFCSQTNCADGEYAGGVLVSDGAGNLYGITIGGGASGSGCGGNWGCGTVFELTPGANGTWTETVLYTFCSGNCSDGAYPSSGLIFDSVGNLYGTTTSGGADNLGTVFTLMPGRNGKWTEKVLHSFGSGTGGNTPFGNVILDASGNLYGTTSQGGSSSRGTVFELTPGANGQWTESVLYNFCSATNCKDGANPLAGVVFDPSGNLYGTTNLGGAYAEGTAFRLTPGANGKWKEDVLHSFNNNGKDGYSPEAGLVLDAAGNLFGTTALGGPGHHNPCGQRGCGTVFELTRNGGKWTEKILDNWGTVRRHGHWPASPIDTPVFDAAGNLYGTTSSGGVKGYGTIFKLTPGKNGKWQGAVLHSFQFRGTDGAFPKAGLIFDASGNLYGTTYQGGNCGIGSNGNGCGTVFEIMP